MAAATYYIETAVGNVRVSGETYRSVTCDVDRRILERVQAGLIPPEPDYARRPKEWRVWYDQHIRCVTPGHNYFLRERDSTLCKFCLEEGVAA